MASSSWNSVAHPVTAAGVRDSVGAGQGGQGSPDAACICLCCHSQDAIVADVMQAQAALHVGIPPRNAALPCAARRWIAG